MSKRRFPTKEETLQLLENISSDDPDEILLLDKTWPISRQERKKGYQKSGKSANYQWLKTITSKTGLNYSSQTFLKQYRTTGVKFKRQVNLFSAVSIIIGSIIGSGIFISPKGVFQYSGSAPLSLIIWAFCGIISLFGALCYAELGTLIPLSGGDYIYLLKAFENLGPAGPVPSFLFLWVSILIFSPSSSAILSITAAEYIVEPLYQECQPPVMVKKLVATLCLCTVAFINCNSVRLTTTLNNIFTSTKLITLIIIIIGGITKYSGGKSSYMFSYAQSSFPSISEIATAIYFGMWAYGGWNSLNWLTEEINHPEKNILRAIMISMPLVTICYILANLAYLSVMSPNEFLSSEAVALSFANNVLGFAAPIIPALVAASTLGCSLVGCFGMGRLACVAAREGHLIGILSYIHIQTFTPIPAILFNLILGIIFVYSGSFDTLINFLSFSAWMFFGLTMIALIYMRWTKKHHTRPYKVPLVFPIIVLLVSMYLVLAPIVQDPRMEYLYAFLFIISGVLFYIPFVHYKLHFSCFDKFSLYVQLLLKVVPVDDNIYEDL